MPAPRLMARSMLSFGTEGFFAFCTASYSVGLPARSAPPILAATSMFLINLANDLARRESMIAFLCLVVAHLECPDMPSILPIASAPGCQARGKADQVSRAAAAGQASSLRRVRRLRFVVVERYLTL